MSDELVNLFVGHLEFLGYECTQSTPDGWTTAVHPGRWTFSLRRFGYKVNFYLALVVGKSLGERRIEILEFLNKANDESAISKFSVAKDVDGDFLLRARASFTSGYDKKVFGAFMDAWHTDTERLRDAPRVPVEDETAVDLETDKSKDVTH